MTKRNSIAVKYATCLDGFRLHIAFTNGKEKIVDFADFITGSKKISLAKYKRTVNFKKFKIEQGNIVWGKDWDLIFPVHELYRGKIN